LKKTADGDKKSFETLLKEYDPLVIKVIEQTLTRNNFHTILSINYKSTSEELASSVWFQMSKKFKKGALFTASILFISYISKVSRTEAKGFMESRIGIRNPEEKLDKLDKNKNKDEDEDKKSNNLVFESIFNFKNEYSESEMPKDEDDFEPPFLNEDDSTSSFLFEDYSESSFLDGENQKKVLDTLTEREKQVLLLTLEGLPKNDIAKKIGKTVKTVYNDMESVKEKAAALLTSKRDKNS